MTLCGGVECMAPYVQRIGASHVCFCTGAFFILNISEHHVCAFSLNTVNDYTWFDSRRVFITHVRLPHVRGFTCCSDAEFSCCL